MQETAGGTGRLARLLMAVLLAVSLLPTGAVAFAADEAQAGGEAAQAAALAADEVAAQSAANEAADANAASAGASSEADAAAQPAAPASGAQEAAAPSAAQAVAVPQAASGLVYTGTAQQGVPAGEAYTLSGAAAADAGDYTATATLEAGYTWADGTTDSKEIAWSIAKATLTATYVDETIAEGEEPALEVAVTGFVNGETDATARGYLAPTVSAPETLSAGEVQLTPMGGMAANYTFAYAAGTLTVRKANTLEPGTYTITANFSMPGAYNPVLPGVTVYPTNPNNPFEDKAGNIPVLDGNDASEVQNAIPLTPVSQKATLTVAADGTKTLTVPLPNPVFTTQDLGTCTELPNVKVKRKTPTDPALWTYGSKADRIYETTIQLTDDLVKGTKSYIFTGSTLYAVPLDREISPSGAVALQLDVEYDTAVLVSKDPTVPTDPTDPTDPDTPTNPDTPTDPVTPSDPTTPTTPTTPETPSTPSTPSGDASSGSVNTTQDGRLAQGTYTVSANIWLDKATTGLPLNPHLTNSAFPPKDPVAGNATLTVDANGRATVAIPVVIQDRIMAINSVSGSNITRTSYGSNGVSLVVMDLGVLSASDTVITGTCTVSVTIGWLAQTIAAGIFNGVWDHTWTAQWQVNFSSAALPSSGGGTMPASALAVLAGVEGVADEASATDAALAALEESAAAAEASGTARQSTRSASGASGTGSDSGADAVAEEAAGFPWAVAAAVAVAALVAVGAGLGVRASRKRAAAGASGGAAGGADSADSGDGPAQG